MDMKVKKRALLSRSSKLKMMSVVIRNEVVFSYAVEHLDTEDFTETERIFQVGWGIITQYYEENGELPERDIFMAECQALIDEDADILYDEEVEELAEWIDEAYSDELKTPYDSEKYNNWGCKMLKRFLEERLARRVQQSIASQERVVYDLPELLNQTRVESELISQIGLTGASDTFPEGWDKRGGICMRSTGLSFLDNQLGGGHAPGEVYMFFAPYGSCKTTLAIQMAVEACKQAEAEEVSEDWDGKRGLAFLVSYEARLEDEIRLRSLSYAAQIRRKSLETMGTDGLEALSHVGRYRKYEKVAFAKAFESGQVVPGEQERATGAMAMLNKHLRVLDMTGYDAGAKGAGGGYVQEIARRIGQELRKTPDTKASVVIVDYIGAMAKRYMAATGQDSNQLRHLIGGAALVARNQIADAYNCPVWCNHQLSGEANSKSPAARLDHTDAAECKAAAENADFAFVAGKQTGDGLLQFVCTKHRRTGSQPSLVLRVVGHENRVELAEGYQVNKHDGTIQSVDEAHATTTREAVVNGTQADDETEQYRINEA